MLTSDQINNIHRLHLVEKWPLRKIARHLKIGRRTLAKYIQTPAPPPTRRDRGSKLDPFKAAIAELLDRDSTAPATVIAERLRTLGYDAASPSFSPSSVARSKVRPGVITPMALNSDEWPTLMLPCVPFRNIAAAPLPSAVSILATVAAG